MSTRRKSGLSGAAERKLQPILSREGEKLRRARKRRRWTQREVARRVGVDQATISRLECGAGAKLSLLLWQQLATLLDLPLDINLGRDALEAPADAGHLDVQELTLRLGRRSGYGRSFELATKPSDPSLSTDVGLTDDVHRRLIQVECVNTFGSVNAAVRSTDRKRAEAEALAVAVGQGDPYLVHQVWVVRATRRNRALLARYPELFASRFLGSSRAWVAALTVGVQPPAELGLVWCDVRATRLFEWRPRRDSELRPRRDSEWRPRRESGTATGQRRDSD
jgi:transcriptional regulator with XRE-family HTH domain